MQPQLSNSCCFSGHRPDKLPPEQSPEGQQLRALLREMVCSKLRAKLEEYLQNTEIDENRFQAEILYFTDRASITEEIVRLRSHFVQLRCV